MEATEEEGIRAGGGPADRRRCRGQGRHVAAWVWTGRGAGSTVPSPPFLLEAAQGPWSPILRCPVPVTVHGLLLQPRALQGREATRSLKQPHPWPRLGCEGGSSRESTANDAGLGTAGLSPPPWGLAHPHGAKAGLGGGCRGRGGGPSAGAQRWADPDGSASPARGLWRLPPSS